MLVKLTKAARLKAGRFVAFAYLLCVLAPSASFAFGDGTRAAPCLTENERGRSVFHVHEHTASAHTDGHDHARATNTPHVHNTAAGVGSPSDDHSRKHHKAGGECCGLMCVTALPAVIVDIGQPATPESLCVLATYRNIADSAPPRHYRPPIS